MSAQTIITTGWKAGELKSVADQIKQVLQDRHDKQVVTMTVVGDTVSTATKQTITLTVNGVSTVLQG